MDTIAQCLASLTVGERRGWRNLTLFPLISKTASPLEYLTLDEALASGGLTITEVGGGGSVPDLAVQNGSHSRVFLMDGEELLGAKQNRVLNASILLEAGAKLVIPVSCVEAGRWDRVSDRFTTSESISHSSLRREKAVQVAASLQHGMGYASDQCWIWGEVDRKLSTMGASSDTAALHDAFAQRRRELDDFVAHCQAQPDQSGVVVAINGVVECADLFDQPRALAKLLPKLVRSYALDALEGGGEKSCEMDAKVVEEFLSAAASAATSHRPSVGLGEDWRLRGERVHGAALIVEETVVHLGLFSGRTDAGTGRSTDMARPSRRRTALWG